MLPRKLNITSNLIKKLKNLRLENPINGHVMTAKELSSAIGKNIAWISQIEGERLKTIKKEDIISIYKVLFNESDDDNAEFIASKDLESFIHDDIKNTQFLEKEQLPSEIYNLDMMENFLDSVKFALLDQYLKLQDEKELSDFTDFLITLDNFISYDFDIFLRIEKSCFCSENYS